jgi:hypothetical protein
MGTGFACSIQARTDTQLFIGRLELVLEASHLLFQHLVVRLQLPNARFRRLEVVDADVGASHCRGSTVPERPAFQHVPPGQAVLLDQRRRRLGGRGALARVLGAQQRENAIETNEIFLLNRELRR